MFKVISYSSTLLLGVLAVFYLAAYMTAPEAGIQVVSMLHLKGTLAGKFYQYTYTAVLMLAALAAFFLFVIEKRPRLVAVVLIASAKVCFVMTVIPLVYSYCHNWKPSFFEHYVGETLTLAASLGAGICAVIRRWKMRRTDAKNAGIDQKR